MVDAIFKYELRIKFSFACNATLTLFHYSQFNSIKMENSSPAESFIAARITLGYARGWKDMNRQFWLPICVGMISKEKCRFTGCLVKLLLFRSLEHEILINSH
jgi:hypothetical protein